MAFVYTVGQTPMKPITWPGDTGSGTTGDGVEEIGTFGDAGSGSVFAYVDAGPAWTAPATGSATYLGEAEGAYVYDDEEGVWWSRMMLEADFATSKINGCVGCDGGRRRR